MNKGKNPSNQEGLEEKFEQFIMDMDNALEALIAFVTEAGVAGRSLLDYSFPSIDLLERIYALVLDEKLEISISLDLFKTRVSRYMGETLRLRVGGHWVMCKDPDDINYGLPCLTAIPGFSEQYEWCPLQVVDNFVYRRKEGLLRKATEANVLT